MQETQNYPAPFPGLDLVQRDRKTSRTPLCKYRAIPGGPPGQFHAHNRDNQPDGLRLVTQTPSTAVPLVVKQSEF